MSKRRSRVGPGCAPSQRHDARLADAFGRLEAEGFEFLRHDAARAEFAEAEFGVHVEVAAQGLGVGEEFFGLVEKFVHGRLLFRLKVGVPKDIGTM